MVTLDTVKKHVGHVLGKLGAANRTEAVARARELSLIPRPGPVVFPARTATHDDQSGSTWRTEIRNSPRSRTLVSSPCRAA